VNIIRSIFIQRILYDLFLMHFILSWTYFTHTNSSVEARTEQTKWTELSVGLLCTVRATQLNWHFSSVQFSSVLPLCTRL